MFGRIRQIVWGALFGTLIATQALGQTATLLPNAKQQFFTAQGIPAAAGTVDMYVPSTTTRKTTWKSSTETVGNQNTNPVLLDAGGFATIYGDGAYRQVVKDADGNTIWDAVTASTGGGGSGPTPPISVGDGNLVGTVIPWAGLVAPSNYVFAYGQAINRTTYSILFSTTTITTNLICTSGLNVLSGISDTQNIRIGAPVEVSCVAPGTTVTAVATNAVTVSSNASVSTAASAIFFPWGNGDGSLTFNVPDLRGRMLPGRNNMGGTASANLTTLGYAISPNALGAIGPPESRTLSTVSLPPYTPSGTIISTLSAANSAVPVANLTSVSGATDTNFVSLRNNANATAGTLAAPVTGTVTSTFTGTAQGGTASPLSIIPPAVTINYVIKVLPDSAPSAIATSISVGTTGVLAGTTNGLLFDNGGVLGNIPSVNNGLLITNGTGVPSFSTIFPSILFDSLTFRGSTSGTVTLSADAVAGTQTVHVPSSSGSMLAFITPQYLGFKCDGTPEAGIGQALHDNLPANGGIAYFPTGSNCVDTSFVTFTKPGVIFTGPSCVTGFASPATGSALKYTGSNARYLDMRSVTGSGVHNLRLTYSTTNPLIMIDAGSNNGGVNLANQNAFSCNFMGPDTNRPGTATLISLAMNVHTRIDSNFFEHGAPAIQGATTLGLNTVAQVSKNFFSLSETVPIIGCGETWIIEQNSFEALRDGTGKAFSTSSSLPCSAIMFVNNWFGDVTAPGGTWIDGYFRGFTFSGNKMAGDLATTQKGIELNISQAVSITGNDFDFLAAAIDCGTAVTGLQIAGNKFGGTSGGTVTTALQNPTNCANVSTENNSPSISRFTSGQILVGQSSADAAPKTMSGDVAIVASGATTIQPGVVSNAKLANSATTVNGQTCTLGSTCTITAAAGSIAVGTTTISSGTSGRVLFDNAGVLGEYTGTQLTAQINAATASLSGALPAWPNNTTTFFRGDGTYAAIGCANLPALTGDVTTSGCAATLATVASAGTSGSSTAIPIITINAKGLTTSITTAAVIAPAGTLTGATLAAGVTASSLTSLGTITSLTATTINAFTLGGAISGGGNNINNVIIGASTPLAGTFTTLTANTSITSPIHAGGSGAASNLTLESTSGAGTTDSISFKTASQSTRMTILSGGNIGIGTETNPQAAVSISGNVTTGISLVSGAILSLVGADTTSTNIALAAYGTGTNPAIVMLGGNGTAATPTASQSGDFLAFYAGKGYASAAADSAASSGFFIAAGENHSAGANGTYLGWFNVANGGTTRTEKMRLAAGLSIGNTTDPGAGGLRATGATIQFTALASDAASTDNTVCINSSGTLLKGSGTLGICLGTSSARYKNRIGNLQDGLAEIMKLRPVNFYYNNEMGHDPAKIQYGFTAEQVVHVLPALVDLDSQRRPNTVDILGMMPIVVRSIQQMNDNFESRLAKLESRK